MSKISKSAINWVEFEKLVPADQKGKFFAFKGKSDMYLRRVLSNPAELPKIDWEHYKKTCPVAGLVDKFQSGYQALKIPYPDDKLSASVDAQWEKLKPEVDQYCAEMDKEITESESALAQINKLPKYSEMTMEMVYDMMPQSALDSVKRPTFWPHTEDEQVGYKTPEQKAAKH